MEGFVGKKAAIVNHKYLVVDDRIWLGMVQLDRR
jgi:hypothetical protein